MKTADGDDDYIKEQLRSKIETYVNGVAPKAYLSIGEINKMGVETSHVDYFQVMSLIISGQQVNQIKLMQEIETKFIFDKITWIGDSNNDDI